MEIRIKIDNLADKISQRINTGYICGFQVHMVNDMYRDPSPCKKCGRWKIAPGAGYIGDFCNCGKHIPIDEDAWFGRPQLRCD